MNINQFDKIKIRDREEVFVVTDPLVAACPSGIDYCEVYVEGHFNTKFLVSHKLIESVLTNIVLN